MAIEEQYPEPIINEPLIIAEQTIVSVEQTQTTAGEPVVLVEAEL